jgi:GH25 family lysozyme M1 (1,4-beta-N-acetylmuramidase)
MSITPARLRRACRRLALGGLGALVAAAIASPVAGSSPSPSAADGAVARSAWLYAPKGSSASSGPPLDTPAEALAAGGRRAVSRSRTVIRQGIDVSHWQGWIDWRRVARSGVDFAIAKATEGTWMVDDRYRANKAGAQRAGIRFTAYHFANPSGRRRDAVREADYFVRHARLNGWNLIPALDLEAHGGLRPRELTDWTLRWLRRVEKKLGVKPMLYTAPGFWHDRMGRTPRIAKAGYRTLWIAHWGTHRPAVPTPWRGAGWTIWQWTETGQVSGVATPVDRNLYSGPKLRQLTIGEVRRNGQPNGRAPGWPRRPMPV